MELALLPLELARWDQAKGGDLLVVPVWTDVRPLRGAAGLVDWRLNGKLSHCLRTERLSGAAGEKLLVPTRRLPWKAVLALGVGSARGFDEGRLRETLALALATARGLALRALGLALPGRELGAIDAAAAARVLRAALDGAEVTSLTLVDTPPALKAMSEVLGPPSPRAAAVR